MTVPALADHSSDGVHRIEYRSTDNAGNLEEAKSCEVKVDTTPPVISVACMTHLHFGWHGAWGRDRSRLSLTYRIDDNLSPTAAVTIELVGFRGKVLRLMSLGQCPTGVLQTYRLPGKLPRGFSRLCVTATDLAGNTQSKLAGDRWPVQH